MVIYYSLSGKTKTYAERIADILGDNVWRLEGVGKNPVFAVLAALITGGKVKALPKIDGETIYLCSPIWAGKPSPFIAYFLKKSNLSGKRVHFVLTCADRNPDKYLSALRTDLAKYGGEVWVFCSQDEGTVDANVQRIVS